MIPICLRVVGSSTGNRRSTSCLAGSDSMEAGRTDEKRIGDETEKWGKVVRAANIKAE
jgi:hypothetical protein